MTRPSRPPDSGGDNDSASSNDVDSSNTGFFAALFDVGFRHLLTPRAVQVYYAVALVVIGLGVIAGVISAVVTMLSHPVTGVVLLVVVPILGLGLLLAVRMFLELVAVVFRIGDDLRALRDRTRR